MLSLNILPSNLQKEWIATPETAVGVVVIECLGLYIKVATGRPVLRRPFKKNVLDLATLQMDLENGYEVLYIEGQFGQMYQWEFFVPPPLTPIPKELSTIPNAYPMHTQYISRDLKNTI